MKSASHDPERNIELAALETSLRSVDFLSCEDSQRCRSGRRRTLAVTGIQPSRCIRRVWDYGSIWLIRTHGNITIETVPV